MATVHAQSVSRTPLEESETSESDCRQTGLARILATTALSREITFLCWLTPTAFTRNQFRQRAPPPDNFISASDPSLYELSPASLLAEQALSRFRHSSQAGPYQKNDLCGVKTYPPCQFRPSRPYDRTIVPKPFANRKFFPSKSRYCADLRSPQFERRPFRCATSMPSLVSHKLVCDSVR